MASNVVPIQQARMKREQASDDVIDSGFIKLYRGVQDVAFKRDPERFALWVHMLLEASHKPYKTILGGQTVELQAGQFISGNRDLSKETGVSVQRIKTSIKFFESEGMITRKTGRDGTIFTITKYTEYQGKKGEQSNPHATHQINPHSNPLEASDCAGSGEGATHQATHQQPTKSTRIQEDNKYTSPNGEECESDDSTRSASAEKSSRYPVCPHRELLDLWAEIIPETVQHNPAEWQSGRAGYKNLAARWKAGFVTMKSDGSGPLYHDRASGIAWWGAFFRYLRRSDFLMNKCRPFSLEWIVKQANYLKAKEGNYHDAK